jgi:hypothetical protein
MTSTAYSADRSAIPVAHCFSPSELIPLVRARTERPQDKRLFSARDLRTGAPSEACFQGLLFYLSPDNNQAEHQIDAISALLREIYLRSLPRVGRPSGNQRS